MRPRILKIISVGWVHLLGMGVMTLIVPALFLDTSTVSLLASSFAHHEFREFTAFDLLIHLGMSACSWALLFIMYRMVVNGIQRRKTSRAYVLSRGTAVTETLIVLPVFLIISLGTVQLAINNIAVVLTNLAAFQAARAVFVWSGEWHGARGGGYVNMVNKAKVQAAQSLAPVAPGDYRSGPSITNDDFLYARAGMLGQQLAGSGQDQGNAALDDAPDLKSTSDGSDVSAIKKNLSLSRSLDQSNFRIRSVRKLTWAWNATMVIPVSFAPSSAARAGARVRYSHNIAMPLMTQVFGEHGTVAGREGYYMTITRTFMYPAQVPANPVYPEPH